MANPGGRGGWSTDLLTGNLMADPRSQYSMRFNMLAGISLAQHHQVHMGPENRNYNRSHRTERTRGIVGGPSDE